MPSVGLFSISFRNISCSRDNALNLSAFHAISGLRAEYKGRAGPATRFGQRPPFQGPTAIQQGRTAPQSASTGESFDTQVHERDLSLMTRYGKSESGLCCFRACVRTG